MGEISNNYCHSLTHRRKKARQILHHSYAATKTHNNYPQHVAPGPDANIRTVPAAAMEPKEKKRGFFCFFEKKNILTRTVKTGAYLCIVEQKEQCHVKE